MQKVSHLTQVFWARSLYVPFEILKWATTGVAQAYEGRAVCWRGTGQRSVTVFAHPSSVERKLITPVRNPRWEIKQ